MKKILVTGNNDFISSSFEKWMLKHSQYYGVSTLNVCENSWNELDFSEYDTVLHVAEVDRTSNKKNMTDLFFEVNRDLAIKIAYKAKEEGVGHFILMSTSLLYDREFEWNDQSYINTDTIKPKNSYAQSKYEADVVIQSLSDNSFITSIIRPPMIYGSNCIGILSSIKRVARKVALYPKKDNMISAIYIDNLCEFIRLLIESQLAGVFHPQNSEYWITNKVIRDVRKYFGKKTHQLHILNPIVRFLSLFIPSLYELYTSNMYPISISQTFNGQYIVVSYEDSISAIVKEIEKK